MGCNCEPMGVEPYVEHEFTCPEYVPPLTPQERRQLRMVLRMPVGEAARRAIGG